MLQKILKKLPAPIKDVLRLLKQKTYDRWYKKRLFKRMQVKHAELLKQLKGKEKIKVVFLAIHQSAWKVDTVFQKMLKDPFFDPIILVCPYTPYGEERMLNDMEQTYKYFFHKGYPVIKPLKENGSWVTLNELDTDIVFFTNPHDLTRKEYYEDAYLNYLSCYVPYHHEVGSYDNNISQYNQPIHNALWLIFSSHKASYNLFEKTSAAKASNVVVTGYPAMEEILYKIKYSIHHNIWKNKDDRLKIIWAPHHTIDDPILPYSNFLEYALLFKQFALDNKDKFVWCFKPHPILKSKLYLHKDWGKTKTDEFYTFWATQPFSQIEEGEYINLFLSSDTMIHDSGSFLAEYLYLRKPVMYLLSENNNRNFYSDFGLSALNACEIGSSFDDVKRFLDKVSLYPKTIKPEHVDFLKTEVNPYFRPAVPSEKIINEIKNILQCLK